LYDPVLVWS